MTGRFAGCHGVHVAPENVGLRLGWVAVAPPRHAVVEIVDQVERLPGAELLWWMEWPVGSALRRARGEMWRQVDGRLWFGDGLLAENGGADNGGLQLALGIDGASGVISIAPPNQREVSVAEALASIALPALAQSSGALVLHGSAFSRDGRATLVTGPGGRGKSSLLSAMIGVGWNALAEDQCVVDVPECVVWPAGSWVRLRRGVNVPAPISAGRYRWAAGKLAWDLEPWMARRPAQVERVVFLEAPGEPLLEVVPPAVAIGLLARQSPWHLGFNSLGQGLFPQLVDFAMQVPVYRLRVPRSTAWLDEAVSMLGGRTHAALSILRG